VATLQSPSASIFLTAAILVLIIGIGVGVSAEQSGVFHVFFEVTGVFNNCEQDQQFGVEPLPTALRIWWGGTPYIKNLSGNCLLVLIDPERNSYGSIGVQGVGDYEFYYSLDVLFTLYPSDGGAFTAIFYDRISNAPIVFVIDFGGGRAMIQLSDNGYIYILGSANLSLTPGLPVKTSISLRQGSGQISINATVGGQSLGGSYAAPPKRIGSVLFGGDPSMWTQPTRPLYIDDIYITIYQPGNTSITPPHKSTNSSQGILSKIEETWNSLPTVGRVATVVGAILVILLLIVLALRR